MTRNRIDWSEAVAGQYQTSKHQTSKFQTSKYQLVSTSNAADVAETKSSNIGL